MTQPRSYSTYFSCLHDEPTEYGWLGRGTHYSVFRSIEWLDVSRKALPKPEIHDFAVIWDEDHDTRVIEAVERIYMAGLLSPVQFIGERKGMLTVIVASKFWGDGADLEAYGKLIQAAIEPMDDYWPVEIGTFDRSGAVGPDWHQTSPAGIINDAFHKVNVYLSNIDSIWRLGTKAPVWESSMPSAHWVGVAPVARPPLPGAPGQ